MSHHEKDDLGAYESHGGRSDLGSAAPSTASRVGSGTIFSDYWQCECGQVLYSPTTGLAGLNCWKCHKNTWRPIAKPETEPRPNEAQLAWNEVAKILKFGAMTDPWVLLGAVQAALVGCATDSSDSGIGGLPSAAQKSSSFVRADSAWQPIAVREPGLLSVDVYYGVAQHDHVEGPMGLYPRGISDIMDAVHGALLKHEHLSQGRGIAPETTDNDSAWQPISTAPKDGTQILLWITGIEPRPRIGFWSVRSSDVGWFGLQTQHFIGVNVTHWMPLPSPPVVCAPVSATEHSEEQVSASAKENQQPISVTNERSESKEARCEHRWPRGEGAKRRSARCMLPKGHAGKCDVGSGTSSLSEASPSNAQERERNNSSSHLTSLSSQAERGKEEKDSGAALLPVPASAPVTTEPLPSRDYPGYPDEVQRAHMDELDWYK